MIARHKLFYTITGQRMRAVSLDSLGTFSVVGIVDNERGSDATVATSAAATSDGDSMVIDAPEIEDANDITMTNDITVNEHNSSDSDVDMADTCPHDDGLFSKNRVDTIQQ